MRTQGRGGLCVTGLVVAVACLAGTVAILAGATADGVERWHAAGAAAVLDLGGLWICGLLWLIRQPYRPRRVERPSVAAARRDHVSVSHHPDRRDWIA